MQKSLQSDWSRRVQYISYCTLKNCIAEARLPKKLEGTEHTGYSFGFYLFLRMLKSSFRIFSSSVW